MSWAFPYLGEFAMSNTLLQADSNDLMQQAQIFLYANGNTQPPTAIDLDKSLFKDLLFNQSPSKVCINLLKVILFVDTLSASNRCLKSGQYYYC